MDGEIFGLDLNVEWPGFNHNTEYLLYYRLLVIINQEIRRKSRKKNSYKKNILCAQKRKIRPNSPGGHTNSDARDK